MCRRMHRRAARLCVAVCVAGVLGACATKDPEPRRSPDPVDMSGFWEVDYARSDNLQARFSTMVRQLNESQRRAAAAERNNRAPVSAGGTSREALLGLVQMAELITASQLLEVEQDRVSIRVEREGNFSLSCDYGLEGRAANEYGVGRELCYWEGEQLVYYIVLPDGLRISHRLSLAGDRRSLAIDTTVISGAVSQPFNVRRVYRRYVPGSRGYRCTETLTRGRVCTTEDS